MKTNTYTHNSCLYPHPMLKLIKLYTRNDIGSHVRVDVLRIFGFLYELGMIIPLPSAWRTIVGIPRISLIFCVLQKVVYFFGCNFEHLAHAFHIIARSVYGVPWVVVRGSVFLESCKFCIIIAAVPMTTASEQLRNKRIEILAYNV